MLLLLFELLCIQQAHLQNANQPEVFAETDFRNGSESQFRLKREPSYHFRHFSDLMRQRVFGNSVPQCPCVVKPGTHKCIAYDSRYQAASIEEAILAFPDVSADPRMLEESIGGPLDAAAFSCTTLECQTCAALLINRLVAVGLLKSRNEVPIPRPNIVDPHYCKRFRFANPPPRFSPPAVVPSYIKKTIEEGLRFAASGGKSDSSQRQSLRHVSNLASQAAFQQLASLAVRQQKQQQPQQQLHLQQTQQHYQLQQPQQQYQTQVYQQPQYSQLPQQQYGQIAQPINPVPQNMYGPIGVDSQYPALAPMIPPLPVVLPPFHPIRPPPPLPPSIRPTPPFEPVPSTHPFLPQPRLFGQTGNWLKCSVVRLLQCASRLQGRLPGSYTYGAASTKSFGSVGSLKPFKRSKRSTVADKILGNRFGISCINKGEVESEDSDMMNLCSVCWTWRQLPEDYFPRLINELVCKKDGENTCISGWGTCHQRFRNIDVLRKVGGDWQTTTISIANCCDCKVKAGTEAHSLVIGKH